MIDAPERFTEGTLVGHFRLEKMIGRGGMGVVWSAVDTRASRSVALKFLADVRRDDVVSHARFLREAETASKLTHPNVVRVHAIDYTLDGTPFLVMDLLEGESLRARMKLARRLSPRECGVLLGPVAAVARAAHEAGIVHRDLKPENVFLSTAGVRVLDFGIAKRLSPGEVQDTFTSTGAMVGTPAYMAPEQIFGERNIDGKADVWALGVIFYECLSGARPAEGGVGQILKAITSGSIPPLDALVTAPELAGVCRFVMTMLAPHPSDRPSMADVERVLAGLRDASGRSDVSPAVAYSGTRHGGRGRVGLAVAAGVAFTIGFVAIFRFEKSHRSVASVASVASPNASAPSVPSDISVAIAAPLADAAPIASPSSSARSAPTPSARAQASQQREAPSTRVPEFDVALRSVRGMGNQSTQSDVVDVLKTMRPCLPAPAGSELWTIAVAASWPKGGARTETFTAQRSSITVTSPQAAAMEACAKKIFDAATIAVPDGQDEAGGTSYLHMSVGYD